MDSLISLISLDSLISLLSLMAARLCDRVDPAIPPLAITATLVSFSFSIASLTFALSFCVCKRVRGRSFNSLLDCIAFSSFPSLATSLVLLAARLCDRVDPTIPPLAIAAIRAAPVFFSFSSSVTSLAFTLSFCPCERVRGLLRILFGRPFNLLFDFRPMRVRLSAHFLQVILSISFTFSSEQE